jgi:hypothetical protein
MNKLNKRTSQAWLGLRCGGHVCVCPWCIVVLVNLFFSFSFV